MFAVTPFIYETLHQLAFELRLAKYGEVSILENARFLNIPFAGHEAHKESPEIFITAVNQFLKGNIGGPITAA